MTFEQCTKQELLYIIDTYLFGYLKKEALSDIQQKRIDKNFEQAERWNKIAIDNLNKYNDLTKNFVGKPIKAIPEEVLEQASEYKKLFLEASKKRRILHNKCTYN